MANTNTGLLEQPFKVTGSSKDIKNKVGDNVLNRIGTGRILWHLVRRHKFAIVVLWAIIVTIDSIFPPVWDILGSLVSLR